MWDYDKLFAEGNIVGVNIKCKNVFNISSVDNENVYEWKLYYANDELKYQDNEHRDYESYIQYIIRLDEHGNVVERLFDREKDMSKPMPELETGMFVRVYDKSDDITALAFVYKEGGRLIYQDGDFDDIADVIKGDYNKIVEVYPTNILSFNCCYRGAEIWRDPNTNLNLTQNLTK